MASWERLISLSLCKNKVILIYVGWHQCKYALRQEIRCGNSSRSPSEFIKSHHLLSQFLPSLFSIKTFLFSKGSRKLSTSWLTEDNLLMQSRLPQHSLAPPGQPSHLPALFLQTCWLHFWNSGGLTSWSQRHWFWSSVVLFSEGMQWTVLFWEPPPQEVVHWKRDVERIVVPP